MAAIPAPRVRPPGSAPARLLRSRHFLPGVKKALPGGGADGDTRAMVALENPEGGSEAAVAAAETPGRRRTL